MGLAILAFYGLAYRLLPYLVVDRLDIGQAASAPELLLSIDDSPGQTKRVE